MAQSVDFTIADVLAWARTKPADQSYSFYDASSCAVAQFGRATGRECLVGMPGKTMAQKHPALLQAAIGLPWNFGAFAARLETLCPNAIVSDTWTKADAYLTEQVPA
jgi:hypothetical protein